MVFFACNVLNYGLALGLLALIFYLYMRYKHTYWQRRGVRSVPGHWLFGNLKDSILMRVSPGVLFGSLHRQGTDEDKVLGTYILYKPFLLIRDPELIKHVMIVDFNVFPDRYFSAKSKTDKVGSGSLFNMDNPEWKYLRVKMSPVFTTGKLKKLFYLMVDTAESMKDHLEKQFEDGANTKEILIRDVLSKYTTDIISNLAFGIRTNSFSKSEFYDRSMEPFSTNLLDAIRFFVMFFFPDLGQYVAGSLLGSQTEYFRKVFHDSLDSRQASNAKRGDVIDSLIELKNDKQTEFEITDDILLAQSAIFLLAGRETSITTITFTLVELAKYPEIQAKLREEIYEKMKEKGLTYEAVQDMKYLNQVISEVLRLYPPAPIIDRVARADYKIPGTDIMIEKGTPVYVALRGLHYDERFFPDPTRFDPDRFSEERRNEIGQCTYMPFGEGPRICIGMRVGTFQTAVGLITILRNYKVIPHPNYQCVEDPRNVFTAPIDGFKLNFTKLY